MSDQYEEWYYDYIVETISSPQFRNPIKDFIDRNCESFIGIEENSFEQGKIFKEFTELIETLLSISLMDVGITDEMFCLAAKRGLENKIAKKYFEQLISFTNYNYFKNLMTKRNRELEEEAFEKMTGKKIKKENKKNKEDIDLKVAIEMSKACEEEKKKLQLLEEIELKRAIKLSQIQSSKIQNDPVVESYKKKAPVNLIPSVDNKSTPSPKDNSSNNNNMQNSGFSLLKDSKIEENKKEIPIIPQKPKIEIPKKEEKKIEEKKIEEVKKIEEEKKEENEEEQKPIFDEEDEPMNPIDKVLNKEKREIPESNIQFEVGQKLPVFSGGRGTLSSTLNKSLNDIEAEKARKLREYREMIINMRLEKRKKKEELDNNNSNNEEEKRRLALRMQLAEKLKKKNLENFKKEKE